MTPLHHLLLATDLTPAELAADFLNAGRAYGATIDTLSGNQLRHWGLGHQHMPAWAHHTAYTMAMEHGWPLDNDEAIGIAMRTYRALNPDTTLEQFRADHPTLVDNPEVTPMWIEIGAHYRRRRTAEPSV